MKGARLVGILLVIFSSAGLAYEAAAQQHPITLAIDFGGQCTPPNPVSGDASTAPVVLNITSGGQPFVCGNYTIRPKSSTDGNGQARLESGVDTSNDVLVLKNVKITKAAGTWPDFHITISGVAKYQTIPDAIPPGSGVGYYISGGTGYFKRGILNNLAVGSYIKTRGYQENPTNTAPWNWLGSNPPSATNGVEIAFIVCGTAGCSNTLPGDTAHSTWDTSHPLAATRDLKAEFWVSLFDNTDALYLTTLSVQNGAPGKGGGPTPDDAPPGCPDERCMPCQKNSEKCAHAPDPRHP